MKKYISIVIISLILVGIGSAQNYMPGFAMEPNSGIEMDSMTPGDFEMWGGAIKNATMGGSMPWAVVGPYLWCDYVTDGSDDAIEVIQAYNDGYDCVIIAGFITVNATNPIWFPDGQKRLTSVSYYTNSVRLDPLSSGPIIVMNTSGNEIDHITIDGNRSGYVDGEYGIYWTESNQNYIHHSRICNTGSDAIHIHAPEYSLGGGAIHNNYIYNSYRYGLRLSGNDLMFLDNSVGWGNDIAIYLSDAHNNLISRNHIWANYSSDAAITYATVRIDGDQNVVSLNDFDGITKWCIVLNGGSDYTQIVNNKFWNVIYDGGYAMLIDATADTSTHLTVTGNMLRAIGNATYVLNIDPSHNHTIVGNNFDGKASWGMAGNTVYGNDMVIGS